MSDSVADNPARRPFAVRLTGVTKTFGGVTALSDVSLDVYVGEIHALLGENGAGKSTILKILNGVHAPTAGRIEVYGEPLEEHTPEAAKRAGIGMIFQEMSFVPTLSAAQNIFLNNEAKDGLGLIDDKAAARRARELFETLGVEIDPKVLVGDLSAGQRQLTEIVKAISRNVRVLILDEPTTALSGGEVEKLFAFLRRLKSEGVAIIYVSHRMDEITRIADRATILRDGRHVVTAPMSDLTLDKIIEYIVGRRSRGFSDVKRRNASRGAPLLEVRSLSGPRKPISVDLTLYAGEVVGVAGLLGSGRSALARVLFGIDSKRAGEILIRGTPVEIANPGDAIAKGMALVPEDRLRQGLILEHSVEFEHVLVHPRPPGVVAVRVVGQGVRSGRPSDRWIAHQDGFARRGGAHPLRRQSAKSGDRQMAERRAGYFRARRADRRRRYRLEGRDHRARPRPRRARQGGARHLLGTLGIADCL